MSQCICFSISKKQIIVLYKLPFQVSVSDFTDVMTRGVWAKHFEKRLLHAQNSDVRMQYGTLQLGNISGDSISIGIVPPRNEIGKLHSC
jgi:hypothetical protein